MYDSKGNQITGAAVAFSVATAAAGTIDQSGAFKASATPGTFSAAVIAKAGTAQATADVIIQVGALARLDLKPAVATVRAGQSVVFAATGSDANGSPVTVTPTWTILHNGGTITSAGIFTAGNTPGTFADTVQASASGLAATATVVVTAGPTVQVALTPDHPTLAAGATQQFSAVASDSHGNPVASAITWSADSNAGAITAGGLFTAGRSAGDFNAAVTATVDGIAGTTAVRVSQPAGTDGGTGTDGGNGSDGGNGGRTSDGKGGCTQVPVSGLAVLAAAMLLLRKKRSGSQAS